MVDQERLSQLAKELKDGDLSRFEEFYESTKRIILANIYGYVGQKETAEDLIQETYVNFLKTLPKFDPDKPAIGYLLTISRNLSLNYLKSSSRVREFKEREEESISQSDRYRYDEDDLLQKMRRILKPREFEIVYLKVVEDYTHHEIATLLKRPLGTVLWAYNNAIKKLRKGLEKDYGQ